MKTSADLNHLKLALRDNLCGECPEHAPAQPIEHPLEAQSAQPDATAPAAASCETDCSVFVNLPRLARVAKEGEPPCGYSVYEKSLESCDGQVRKTDLAQALTILESAEKEKKPASD
jgi:hypothetical protein